jgi:predicted DNA-binding transcriptional regulator AlpA
MTDVARLHPDDIDVVVRLVVEALAQREEESLPRDGSALDPLLEASQVAELLGYTERYVWRLGREGLLPRVKLPGRKYVRFPLSGVIAYVESGRSAVRAEPSTEIVTGADVSEHRIVQRRPNRPRKRF